MESNKREYDFIRMVIEKGWSEMTPDKPAVLSCGGIYIPPKNTARSDFSYNVLTTSNQNEPVKVVHTMPAKNQLSVILAKENLN